MGRKNREKHESGGQGRKSIYFSKNVQKPEILMNVLN